MSGSNVVSRAQTSRDAAYEEFDAHYEIDRTVREIADNSYKSVALQFPDELLASSSAVYKRLKKLLKGRGQSDCRVFILGDTSYGKEYVDEVNAQHLNADYIVHYGPACVSGTSTVPVSYVFGRAPFDNSVFMSQFEAKFPDTSDTKEVLLLFDVRYAYAMSDLENSIRKARPKAIIGHVHHKPRVQRQQQRPKCCKMDGLNEVNEEDETKREDEKECAQEAVVNEGSCGNDGAKSCCGVSSTSSLAAAVTDAAGNEVVDPNTLDFTVGGLQVDLPEGAALSEYMIVFIGEEGNQLTNIIMQCNESECFTFRVVDCCFRREGLEVNKLLMKRFYLVQKAKEARCVGLVVGTLSVGSYLEVLDKLRRMIERAGRKTYTFVVGKINIAKLGNFPLIDVFVLIAGPESSLIDAKDYHVPVVTPYEMQLALKPGEYGWTGRYSTDFASVLRVDEQEFVVEEEEDGERGSSDDGGDGPAFSLVSGGFVSRPAVAKRQKGGSKKGGEDCTEVALRNNETRLSNNVISPAAAFLASREYQGLLPRVGETDVHRAIEGNTGTARDYRGMTGRLESRERLTAGGGSMHYNPLPNSFAIQQRAGVRTSAGVQTSASVAARVKPLVEQLPRGVGTADARVEVAEEEEGSDEEAGAAADFLDAFGNTSSEEDE
jgi:diphthamide biosynthesis protein 2